MDAPETRNSAAGDKWTFSRMRDIELSTLITAVTLLLVFVELMLVLFGWTQGYGNAYEEFRHVSIITLCVSFLLCTFALLVTVPKSVAQHVSESAKRAVTYVIATGLVSLGLCNGVFSQFLSSQVYLGAWFYQLNAIVSFVVAFAHWICALRMLASEDSRQLQQNIVACYAVKQNTRDLYI